jgi:putative ABC transport system substrate-binding protein
MRSLAGGGMRRREFLCVMVGAAAWAPPAFAQSPPAMLRVGAMSPQPRVRSFLQGFDGRMRELGYVEGQNLTMDYIDLQGRPERYPDGMQQLVDRKADVIIAFGPEDALKAAQAATKTIPIIMAAID